MKTTVFFKTVVCVLFAVVWVSCSKDKEEWHEAQFEMVVAPDADTHMVSFYAAAKKITIDWGDGTIEEFTAEKVRVFAHTYSELDWHTISVSADGLTELRYPNNDSVSFIADGILKELKLIDCRDLLTLHCGWHDLTELDLTHCQNLKDLDCARSDLRLLNISKNTELMSLECSSNKLTALDVSKNTKLTRFSCVNNQLTSLDLTPHKILENIECGRNQLVVLSIAENSGLWSLSCENNQLSASVLNTIFNNLPARQSNANRFAGLNIYGNPGADECDINIAVNKGYLINWRL